MPLIKKLDNEKYSLAVWKITESEDELLASLHLSNEEQTELNQIKAPQARTEWAACRKLLKAVLHTENVFVVKDTFGKPYIENSSRHISISHTHGYAAAMISDKCCGIDVHKLETRIEKIAPKFISEEEWLSIDDNSDRLNKIHLYWSAKEAMYKFYGKKQLGFRNHMKVLPFLLQEKGILHGIISKGSYKMDLQIEYLFEHDYLLAFAYSL